ncbi:disease resistance protein TAO1-like [Eucalyptus grandis]|uniref:disease resistance protein TAO1-like n=1 Tax=Eucalyptus grandis TaxID=71139 RepID=UPI00192EE9B4|nr:disease resistance protein TAO1-like [Eucalyptus grandis]
MLILEYCENLEGFDPSIENVKCLVSLNLISCGKLKNLPERLGELRKLEELLVDNTSIGIIPTCIEFLTELKMLSAVGCEKLTSVPSSISHLVNLSTLKLKRCKALHELPDSIQACRKLQHLSLAGCYELTKIPSSIGKMGELELPDSIGELTKLKILRISHTEIEKLPSAIGKLTSLQELDASGCQKLTGQLLLDEGGLPSLSTLRLGSAKISCLLDDSHERSTLKLRELSALEHLDLLYCTELQSLPEPPSGLLSLQLTCLSKKLPSLSHLSHLEKLTLHSCMSLRSIPKLPSCIQELRVQKCPELKKLSNLHELKFLLELEFWQCYRLERLDVEALDCLRKLGLSTSTELSNLNDFEVLESLRYLDPQSHNEKVDNLQAIQGLEKLGSLEVLDIFGLEHIQKLDLSKSEHLKVLTVKNCKSLVEICCHSKFLKDFACDGCESLKKFPDYLAHGKP